MKVLIAENEPVSQQMLAMILAKWGFETVAVNDGIEAVEQMARPDPPKIVILDWNMPRMDGLQACERIRARPTDLPEYLIMLTVRADKADIVKAIEAGANDYILKPYDTEELRVRVGAARKIVELQAQLMDNIKELKSAIEHIKTLQGFLPICVYCKKIRNDDNYWQKIESYISSHSEVKFSHGICPECYSSNVVPLIEEQEKSAKNPQ